MILHALRLVTVLNALDAGLTTAAEAEEQITFGSEIHHVHDPAGALGLDGLTPLRLALARVAHRWPAGRGWGLAIVQPGRLSALRGPVALSRAALAVAQPASAVVLSHDGTPAWLPTLLGHEQVDAVQWTLHAAERPAFALSPGEAARELSATMARVTQHLDDLGLAAGTRPGEAFSLDLGPAYPPSAQALVDRALLVAEAASAGLDASAEVLHSHGVLTRERHLGDLRDACWQVVSAVASWPTHLSRE